jgi:hypothetical protein
VCASLRQVDFLKSWVRSLYMPSYEDLNYPPGLQITNLSCVLRYVSSFVLWYVDSNRAA